MFPILLRIFKYTIFAIVLTSANAREPTIDTMITSFLDEVNTIRASVLPEASNMQMMTITEDPESSVLVKRATCEGTPATTPITNPANFTYFDMKAADFTAFIKTFGDILKKYDFSKEFAGCQDDDCLKYLFMLDVRSAQIKCLEMVCQSDSLSLIRCVVNPSYIYTKNNYIIPYLPGKRCSECDPPGGELCYKDLCATEKECKSKQLNCECKRHCLNCGELDKVNCQCKCKDGWQNYLSYHCEEPCQDAVNFCGRSPGYPKEYCEKPPVQNKYCRHFCGKCRKVDFREFKNEDVCCRGKICPIGYFLDHECICKPREEAIQIFYDIEEGRKSRIIPQSIVKLNRTVWPRIYHPFIKLPDLDDKSAAVINNCNCYHLLMASFSIIKYFSQFFTN